MIHHHRNRLAWQATLDYVNSLTPEERGFDGGEPVGYELTDKALAVLDREWNAAAAIREHEQVCAGDPVEGECQTAQALAAGWVAATREAG